jgi:hypothetical protein
LEFRDVAFYELSNAIFNGEAHQFRKDRTEMKKNPEATAKTFRAMVASSAF